MKKTLIVMMMIIIIVIICSIPILLAGIFTVNAESYIMSIEQLKQERLGMGILALGVIIFDNILIILLCTIISKLKKIKKNILYFLNDK